VLDRLVAPRAPIAGVDFTRPSVMGVVNVTPDSFSDGGAHAGTGQAIAHGLSLAGAGADILDIGGESTRPGAAPVPEAEEVDRVVPVIEGLVAAGCATPISIDTRKAGVARAALAAGARIVNDVSALTYDPDMAGAARGAEGLCLMHALGDPRTMQDDPRFDDVRLDICDYLESRITAAVAAGIERSRIVIDPGIGFGKTVNHNLALIRDLDLFHGLGCPVLLGVSRKGFIGRLSGETVAARRVPGSLAAGLAGVAAGAQILRVHDVAETVQALRIWQALNEAGE
jgi:dihydropteroate synthase